MDAFVLTELELFSRIIDLIYEGAVDPFSWNKIIAALAEYMQSSKAMLFTPTRFVGEGGFYFNVDIPESAMDLWRSRYQPHDLWLSKAISTNAFVEGNTFIGEELVPKEELTNSIWYKEFLSSIGIGQVLANVVYGAESKQPPMTSLSFFRTIDEKPYEAYDKFKASLILPHVSKSLGVMVRLRNAECQMATTLTALDRINHGILLLDELGYVSFANQAAKKMLTRNDGLSLKGVNGLTDKSALFAAKSSDQDSLDAAISEVINRETVKVKHFSRAVVIKKLRSDSNFTLNFSPLPEVHQFAVSHTAPKAIIFIRDQSQPLVFNKDMLKMAYGFTATEIEIVEHVSTGLTVEEIGETLKVSTNTIKTHLKHIYHKTNTRNRVELVRLLISLGDNP